MSNTLLCDRPCGLLTETQKLLNKQRGGLLAIYLRTGVPYHWLKKFRGGKIPNPSVNRIAFLYESLAGKKYGSK